MPRRGIEAWDREGEALHDADGLAAFCDSLRDALPPSVRLVELDTHINDAAFSDAVLAIFDEWVAAGYIPRGSGTVTAS